MTTNLTQLNKKIAALQAQAEVLRKKDAAGVIKRIKEAIQHYDLTAADLGFGSKPSKAAKPATKRQAPAKKGRRQPGAPKYRDETGRTWTGQGRRPAVVRRRPGRWQEAGGPAGVRLLAGAVPWRSSRPPATKTALG